MATHGTEVRSTRAADERRFDYRLAWLGRPTDLGSAPPAALGVQQEAVMANDLWRLFARSLSSTLRWASALKRGLIGSQTAIGSANSADLAHRKTKEKVGESVSAFPPEDIR